jgi:hypothetical protein
MASISAASGRMRGLRAHCIALHCIALHCIALHCIARPGQVGFAADAGIPFVCLQLKSLREQLHIADGSLGLQRQQHDAFVSAYDVTALTASLAMPSPACAVYRCTTPPWADPAHPDSITYLLTYIRSQPGQPASQATLPPAAPVGLQ